MYGVGWRMMGVRWTSVKNADILSSNFLLDWILKSERGFFSLLLPVHEHINRFLTKLHRYPHLFHAIFIYIYGKVKHSILPHKCAYSKLYYVFHWFFFFFFLSSHANIALRTSGWKKAKKKKNKKRINLLH